jgi:translation initiation factor 1 (eIF-1/SUI1)
MNKLNKNSMDNFDDFDDINKNINNLNNDLDDELNNPNFDEDDLNNNSFFNDEIHIYKQKNKNKQSIVISGLTFKKNDEYNDFLKNVKKKFGIGGCHKIVENISLDVKCFIFNGNYEDKIKDYIIKELKIDEDIIKIHG